MFPTPTINKNKQERQLLKLYSSLDKKNKHALIEFAEFLSERSKKGSQSNDEASEVITEPLNIPRPKEESVIKAIKRLRATYPMVEEETVLHPISDLMTAHMIQGKESKSVIDELEILFQNEFVKTQNNSE